MGSDREEGGFVQVTTKKHKTTASQRRKGKQRAVPQERPLDDLVASKRRMISSSGYAARCLEQIKNDTAGLASVYKVLGTCKRCLCFGLGSLRDSPQSLLQLAFFLELLSLLNASPERVIFVDPAFQPEDIEYLEQLGYIVQAPDNNLLELDEDTFLYMPHCPRFLYEELLRRNGEKLAHLYLLANQLDSYADRELRSEELAKIPSLRQLGSRVVSLALPEFEERPDAFNDMAWQAARDCK